MDEIKKNLESIRRNIGIIKIEMIVFAYLVSFLIGLLIGRLIWG